MRAIAYGSHFSTCHVWFEEIHSVDELMELEKECSQYDCLVIHGNRTLIKEKGIDVIMQSSLLTDLTKNDDELLNLMTKTIRNEINRAVRESVEVKLYTSDDIKANPGLVESFAAMYHEMYAEKGMDSVQLPTKELAGYVEVGQLLISVARVEGKPVVYHSYVYGDGNSRFLHSCSEFRVADNATRNAIGRANKYLHWMDFQRLRPLGVATYDWGGITSVSEPNGIDRFKMSFGAEPVVYYNISCPLSVKYRLYDKAWSILHRTSGGDND